MNLAPTLERILIATLEIGVAADGTDATLIRQLVSERERLLDSLAGRKAGQAAEIELVNKIQLTERQLLAKWSGQSTAISDVLQRIRTFSSARSAYGAPANPSPRMLEEQA